MRWHCFAIDMAFYFCYNDHAQNCSFKLNTDRWNRGVSCFRSSLTRTDAFEKAPVFCFLSKFIKGGFHLKQKRLPTKQTEQKSKSGGRWKALYAGFIALIMSALFSTPAFATDTIWTKATEIMKDVYSQILAISTILSSLSRSRDCALPTRTLLMYSEILYPVSFLKRELR